MQIHLCEFTNHRKYSEHLPILNTIIAKLKLIVYYLEIIVNSLPRNRNLSVMPFKSWTNGSKQKIQ